MKQGMRWGLLPTLSVLLGLGGTAQSADEVVLRVGSQSLSQEALEQRLAKLTALGLTPFGKNHTERVRGYLEQVAIPELLLAQAAQTQKLHQDARLRMRYDQALGQGVEQELSQSLLASVSEAEVQRYFETHRKSFEVPAALQLWRILVETRELAHEIVAKCQGAEGVARWRELAREHSLDKATYLRGGSLGFVRADGSTDVPQLQIDSALYAAANTVADGSIVAEPVKEGARFAVVWRRGSRAGSQMSLAEVSPSIRNTLLRDKTRLALQDLLKLLHEQQVRELHPEHIESADFPLPSFVPDDAFPAPTSASAGPLRPPAPSERGLR